MTHRRQLLTGFPGFVLFTVVLIGGSAGLLTMVARAPGNSTAIWVSALVATVIQIAAFPIVRGLATKNIMLGWGVGSLLRLLSLVAYALAATLLGLPLPAALLSLLG